MNHIQHISKYSEDIITGSSVATIIDHSVNPDGTFTERIIVALITAVFIPFFKDLSGIVIDKLKQKSNHHGNK